MRLRTIAVLATLVVALIALLSIPGSSSAKGCDTVPKFRGWAQKVWDVDRWQRGKPGRAIIRTQRHRLACLPAGSERAAGKRIWGNLQSAFFDERDRCLGGMLVAGRVSVFGGGLTAGGYQATEPGIALLRHDTLGRVYRVTTEGRTAYLRHIDYGPASWTGRAIDITYAGASKLGGVTTDAWGEARLVPPRCF